eukprot:6176910-Pleurochrysis_carterae.AAC.1
MFVRSKYGIRATENHNDKIIIEITRRFLSIHRHYNNTDKPFNPPNWSRTGVLGGMRRWRDIWDITHDPIGRIRSAAVFNVVPVATIMKTMFNMGLRAISG